MGGELSAGGIRWLYGHLPPIAFGVTRFAAISADSTSAPIQDNTCGSGRRPQEVLGYLLWAAMRIAAPEAGGGGQASKSASV